MLLLRPGIAVVALLTVCGPALSQSNGTTWQFALARSLLEGALPELVGSDVPITVTLSTPFNYEWLFSTRVVIRVLGEKGAAAESSADSVIDRYLTADFTFDKEHLEHASFIGQRVKSREMAALTAEAKAHPEWTDEQLTAAMEAAGAQYAVSKKQSFIKALRLERFSNALGKIRNSNVRFWWRFGRPDLGADDVVTPSWVVGVETAGSDQRRRCYVLFFEPIGGNLTMVNGVPCQ